MAWGVYSVASIFASIVGGYIVENWEARWSFHLYALVAISAAASAYTMSKDCEKADVNEPAG
jgi:hypothetical protein